MIVSSLKSPGATIHYYFFCFLPDTLSKSSSQDLFVATSPSVAYCLAPKQLVPVFSSAAACLTPVLLEIYHGTREN